MWDFDKFQDTLSTEHDLPADWVQSTLKVCVYGGLFSGCITVLMQRRMISIMTTCYHSVKHKLSATNGHFDLLGFDFMLDTELNVRHTHHTHPHTVCTHTHTHRVQQVWLIEINVNPALHTNCGTLATLSPSVVSETLGDTTHTLLLSLTPPPHTHTHCYYH